MPQLNEEYILNNRMGMKWNTSRLKGMVLSIHLFWVQIKKYTYKYKLEQNIYILLHTIYLNKKEKRKLSLLNIAKILWYESKSDLLNILYLKRK